MFAYCGNNPPKNKDNSGTSFVQAIPDETLKYILTLLAALDAGTPILELVAVIVVFDSLDTAREQVKAWVEAQTTTTEKKDHHVYVLKDPNQDNMVKYVGRTNNPGRRMVEHKRDPRHPERQNYNMVVLVSGLSKEQAALFEQLLISAYSLAYLENARREISEGNLERYRSYMASIGEIIGGASEDILFDLLGG